MIVTEEKNFINRLSEKLNEMPWLFFILPCMVLLVALVIFPLIYSLWVSLHEYTLMTRQAPQFIGLRNYGKVFTDGRFWGALARTSGIAVTALLCEVLLAFLIASFISKEDFKGRNFFRILIFFPGLINPIATGFTFRLIFNPAGSPINHILSVIAGKTVTIDWIGDTVPALIAVLITDIWQWTPFLIVVFMAALLGLPKEPYEAARLDKASKWQIFTKITLPGVKPVLTIMMLLRLIDLFRLFDYVFVLTGGGPGTDTETISIYSYLLGYNFFDMGYASAVSYILLFILVILATFFIKTAGKELVA